jgi:hypothetical protein
MINEKQSTKMLELLLYSINKVMEKLKDDRHIESVHLLVSFQDGSLIDCGAGEAGLLVGNVLHSLLENKDISRKFLINSAKLLIEKLEEKLEGEL